MVGWLEHLERLTSKGNLKRQALQTKTDENHLRRDEKGLYTLGYEKTNDVLLSK